MLRFGGRRDSRQRFATSISILFDALGSFAQLANLFRRHALNRAQQAAQLRRFFTDDFGYVLGDVARECNPLVGILLEQVRDTLEAICRWRYDVSLLDLRQIRWAYPCEFGELAQGNCLFESLLAKRFSERHRGLGHVVSRPPARGVYRHALVISTSLPPYPTLRQ